MCVCVCVCGGGGEGGGKGAGESLFCLLAGLVSVKDAFNTKHPG